MRDLDNSCGNELYQRFYGRTAQCTDLSSFLPSSRLFLWSLAGRLGRMFLEHVLQSLAGGNCLGLTGVPGNGLLGERRLGEVEKLTAVGQFEARVADVRLAIEFDINPFARRPFF